MTELTEQDKYALLANVPYLINEGVPIDDIERDLKEYGLDYTIDKDLSDERVKVYHNPEGKAVVVHRGSYSVSDWADNWLYGRYGLFNSTGTYKQHKKRNDKALDKYGAENSVLIGHSRAGKYVEELNKERPVQHTYTFNKASHLIESNKKVPDNQTDIRTSSDIVSSMSFLQKGRKKRRRTIKQPTWNFLKAHGTEALSK